MSGLAKYLLENGYEVSGSDINDSKYIDKLRDLGAKVYIGHDEKNLPEDCVVVASTAIKEDNPEMQKARRLGLTVMHRSDVLAKLSKMGKFFIGYSGTHGKTTTSGLCAYVLEKAGLKPSYVVGGMLPDIGTNAHSQDGKFFCAELDESDGTIVKYSPDVVVVNNLEADHLDFYKNGLTSIIETFDKFISNLKPDAKVLINNDCKGATQLSGREFITYGLNNADYTAKNIEYNEDFTTFDIYYAGEFLSDMKICLKGQHNVYNSLAVFAALRESGIDTDLIKPYFETFTGMGRRFQKVCEFDGISVYDDYAHHPTEIKATLSAAKQKEHNRIIAVFQPHTYSRTKELLADFANAFVDADIVYLMDIYAAREIDDGTISSRDVADLVSKNGTETYYIPSLEEIANEIKKIIKPGDIVLSIGAGNVTHLADYFEDIKTKEK